ncbi:formate dehydrogenase accessory protein FdhE [Paracoccus methylovorus]|uniref:Protein FdhE homolog n=1 Tax=Paracoccus methylovorus TaxID=2812658 RepID=A0ABX7JM85_9RHOB|nr:MULTISPECIES: formate dehydrogenase accessory protein FdhE [Paracoccus]QRZ15051.1 formate dehydrogenase accessory protein FdhE [Paracoccus methylovorus]
MSQDLRPSVPPEAASRHFTPVLRPDLATLYAARAARLRALADGHELSAYLMLAADIAEAQEACLTDAPAAGPVDPVALAQNGGWPTILDRMIAHLTPGVSAQVAPHLAKLMQMPEATRRKAALAMAEGRFDATDPALAPFLWAALSVEISLAARSASLPEAAQEEPADCPVCGAAPVASVIHTGDCQGLRYLHCALCECEWHMVRAKCSNCGDSTRLDYLSFDTPEAAIRAEACSACGSYLKVISLERDSDAEVVADDLASLVLDDAARSEGHGRSGFNPFALPAS